jgi:peroxiredoxin Q/BCP
VVLYFYPKDMTKGCTIEAHNFQRDQDQYTKRNTVVLGVSVDSVDSHKQFCTKEGLNFKLLADPDHSGERVWLADESWNNADCLTPHVRH